VLSRHLLGIMAFGAMGAGTMVAAAAPFKVAKQPPFFIRHVECAVGAHIGPVGGCIIGTDDPPPATVVVAPPPDVTTQKTVTQDANGCATKSVTQTDSAGNSATTTQSNC
jgi:hypothetical protein